MELTRNMWTTNAKPHSHMRKNRNTTIEWCHCCTKLHQLACLHVPNISTSLSFAVKLSPLKRTSKSSASKECSGDGLTSSGETDKVEMQLREKRQIRISCTACEE